MSKSIFATTRQKVTGTCWSLVALAILAAPGLAWAQVCNDSGFISKNPDLPSYNLGEKVRVTYTFGAAELTAGTSLTVNDDEVRVGLDCRTALLGGDREDCIGVNGLADADAQNDGTAILYDGGLTFGNVVGTACDGLSFVEGPGENANIVVFTADAPIVFDQGESCFVAFDVLLNDIGLPANWEPSNSQSINQAAGFTGSCTPTLGASSTKSAAYTVEVFPDITLRKEVSINGGVDWFDANVAPFPTGFVPGTLAQYRLIVENVGEEPLANVVINDNSAPLFLGLVDVALPADCLDGDGYFPVGGVCEIDSGDTDFGGLDDVGVCETPGTKTNIASVDGEGAASGDPVEDSDPANVECLAPAIEVTKDGPPLAKVGDEITYTICATNTGGVDLESCVLSNDTILTTPQAFPLPPDDLLSVGEQVCNDYPYTVQPLDPDQLFNEATVTCDVVGSASTVNDLDDHTVNLFQPSIVVTKDGELEGKVGDEVCYDISFANTSSADTPPLVNCTGNDTVLGDLGTFEAGVVKQFCRTLEEGDAPSLMNTATITCYLDGWDNGLPAPASDDHTVDVYTVGAILTKDCAPDTTVTVPDPISWEICVENTGTLAIDCTVNDPTAGITDAPVSVAAGATDCSLTASRPTTSADVPTVTNTATAVCTATGWDNAVPTDPATDTCTVDEPGDEICRTPGFWGTHAGTEKDGRSTNLTQEVIIYNGGSLGTICGEEITNTSVNGYDGFGSWPGDGNGSAVEGICVHPKQEIVRQLARQLIAASLNCVVSGGPADCTGISIYDDFTAANADCAANAEGLSKWIPIIDAFNNGYDSDCHERNLTESDVFDNVPYKVPGPAGSSNACNAATSNDFYLVP